MALRNQNLTMYLREISLFPDTKMDPTYVCRIHYHLLLFVRVLIYFPITAMSLLTGSYLSI